MDAISELPGCWLATQSEREHGEHCSCRRLTAAAQAGPSAIDYTFCHLVLQKRWRMTCDHVPGVAREKVTPQLPARDVRDPIQALLIANVDASPD
ncbi:MAG: hypothetical protein HY661_12970 [Betaproteobacteria bacterium]|nr:hypothetical protein [Betaproteobacteria bacterium]